MSRSRWFVLLGPPLLVVLASAAASTASGGVAPATDAAPPPGALAACRGIAPGRRDAGAGQGPVRPGAAWWRTTPVLDETGTLSGWRLEVGLGDAPLASTVLPPESAASGPVGGTVVVTADDGRRSEVRQVDIAARCQRTIDIGAAVARRATVDRIRDGVLVHLLDRQTRSDLGTWHVEPDGRRSLVLGPVSAEALASAGIPRVWATNLASSRDGRRLAVQSCDPDGCLTRVLDRRTGVVHTWFGGQGDVIGFSGDELVTMAACHGLPCGVLAWESSGRARPLADTSIGAAVTRDGMVVVAVPSDDGITSIAIDPATNVRYPLAVLAPDTVPIRVTGATAGLETGPDEIGLVGPTGIPAFLEVRP